VSPTARTLGWLKEQGYRAQVVERRLPHARTTIDLFGCIDVVGVKGAETVGVQATSGSNMSSRVRKIHTEAIDGARAWLDGGTRRLLVVGWTLYAKADETGKRWRPRIVEVRASELDAPSISASDSA